MSERRAATIKLKNEFLEIEKNPNESFSVGLVSIDDMFKWDVTLMGPPGTYYEGGIFHAILEFPYDYPYQPPTLTFKSKMWHPNVYSDGKVCISILHSAGDDPNGYEDASERWSPAQSVHSILMSVIALLNEPNDNSPANVDAAKQWREDKRGYKRKVLRCVEESLDC